MWSKLILKIDTTLTDIISAKLWSYNISAIEEKENELEVYYHSSQIEKDFQQEISHLPGVIQSSDPIKIEDKNWNSIWESSYDPISIGELCYIRAEFHEPNTSCDHEIIIRPEMAFGTGHHATTYMMIEMMSELKFEGKDVLDYGCGTGILSVFAEKLNARSIFGLDIEPPSIENSIIHREINNCLLSKMNFQLGDLDVIPNDRKFDVILANINRKVLLNKASLLSDRFQDSGQLLLSGILIEDVDLIDSCYNQYFQKLNQRQRGDWVCQLWEPKIL